MDGLLGTTFELRLGEEPFTLRLGDAGLEASRGPATDPAATIATDPGVLQEVLWHGRPWREAVRAGELELDGDRRAGARFLSLFPLPG
jgi:ubiquinone biosynthesis protein UbiJ